VSVANVCESSYRMMEWPQVESIWESVISLHQYTRRFLALSYKASNNFAFIQSAVHVKALHHQATLS